MCIRDRDKETKVSFKKILIGVGYAHSPGLIRFFAVVPELVIPIIFITQFWIFASLIIATKQILNLKNVSGKNIKDLDIKQLGYLFRRSKKRKNADIEFEIELSDKSNKWVLATINQSKTTKEYIVVVHDITQLRSLDSMRRDFISNLSHELRTPVSVIRANSETLIDSALDDKEQAKIFANAILHNAERLTDMVSSLLDLSRIEYGELKLNFEELDLDLSLIHI